MEKLSFDLKAKVVIVIQDTGYQGNAEEYVREFYKKPFDELTTCEAEILVRTLENKKGCLCEPATPHEPIPLDPDAPPQI